MTITKSIGNTLLFIFILNLISSWVLFEIPFELETLKALYWFCTPYLILIVILTYLGLVKNSGFLSVSSTSYQYYVYGIILGIAFVFMQTPLNLIYNEVFNVDFNIPWKLTSKRLLEWSTFSTVLIVPIYEEFFFRKYIQQDFQKSFHPVLAILFSSILFASIHLPLDRLLSDSYIFTIHHPYITFFGGLISGTLYYKSKSIGPSILMHLFWNLMVMIS